MLHKQKLRISRSGQSVLKATVLFKFRAHRSLLTIGNVFAAPRRTERRVHDDESHLLIGEAIHLQRVCFFLSANILYILSLNQHICKADRVGFRIDLLSEQTHVNIGVLTAKVVASSGKHAARAAGCVQHSRNLTFLGKKIIAPLRKKEIRHQTDDLTRSIVIARFSIFGETTNQVLEDITHLHSIDMVGVKVKLGEFFYNTIQTVALVHFVDLCIELQEFIQD